MEHTIAAAIRRFANEDAIAAAAYTSDGVDDPDTTRGRMR